VGNPHQGERADDGLTAQPTPSTPRRRRGGVGDLWSIGFLAAARVLTKCPAYDSL
jgi:hypothetical protein